MSIKPECDETHWPLAILVAEAPMDAASVSSALDRIQRWQERQQPFALLLIAACDPVLRGDAMLPQLVVQRIESAGDALHRSLLGVAIVAPTAITETIRQSLARLPLDMPLEIFEKSLTAVEWLCRAVLAPAGLTIEGL